MGHRPQTNDILNPVSGSDAVIHTGHRAMSIASLLQSPEASYDETSYSAESFFSDQPYQVSSDDENQFHHNDDRYDNLVQPHEISHKIADISSTQPLPLQCNEGYYYKGEGGDSVEIDAPESDIALLLLSSSSSSSSSSPSTKTSSSSTKKRGRPKGAARDNGNGSLIKRRAEIGLNIHNGLKENKEKGVEEHYETLESDGTFAKIFGNAVESQHCQYESQLPELNDTKIILGKAIERNNTKDMKKSLDSIWKSFTNLYLKDHIFGMRVQFSPRTSDSKCFPGKDFSMILGYYLIVVIYPGYSELEDEVVNPVGLRELKEYMTIGKFLLYNVKKRCDASIFNISSNEFLSIQSRDHIKQKFKDTINWFYQIFYSIYETIPTGSCPIEYSASILAKYIAICEIDKIPENFDQAATAMVIIRALGGDTTVYNISKTVNSGRANTNT